MKPMVVGIGGAGGNILKQFLQSQDVLLPAMAFGEHLAFGNAKGVWLDSATQDAQEQDYYGDLEMGEYPGYLICHRVISDDSDLKKWIMERYGFDLKAQGYDRRAEYLKGIFEVFDLDEVKEMARKEFDKEDNPLPGYMWKKGIRPFTVIGLGAGAPKGSGVKAATGEGSKEEGGKGAMLSGLLNSLGHSLGSAIDAINRNNNGSENNEYISKILCDSILFLASLGGGTGTGFINPITSYVRREQKAFPIFALGILTEKGEDARKAKEGQRNLGATIALYDLLTKPSGEGIDALMVIDNQVLKEKYKGDFKAMDAAMYSCLRPLLDLRNYPGSKLQDDAPALQRVVWDADEDDILTTADGTKFLLPPILVPCYHSHDGMRGGERALVEHALEQGSRLFPCVPDRADRALVFTRGFVRESEIVKAIDALTDGKITKTHVYRKLGDGGSEDILILLRNPYGGVPGEHKKEGTLESRIYNIVDSAIGYIDDQEINIIDGRPYTPLTKEHLRSYFYGPGGLREELVKARERIAEGKKPVFLKPLNIFSRKSLEAAFEEEDEDLAEKEKIEMLVRKEVQKLLATADFEKKVKEIVKN